MKPRIEPLLSTDPEFVGSWKLIGRLGAGGYSNIFLAQRKETKAAIKIIRRDSVNSPKVFDRFTAEIKNLRQLKHPNIIEYIDSDISTQVPFIAMEYVEGQTLEQVITNKGPLSEILWINYFSSMVTALEYCHSKNIIHKDLSPANIMISDGIPKLIDFGFAYEKGVERLSSVDEIVGTDSFLSPEHVNGSNPTEAMDVFSLASTFLFAAVAQLPFRAEKKIDMWTKIEFALPSLENLTDLQKNILIPMFYKNPVQRPTFFEINKAMQNYDLDGHIDDYKQKLKNSSNQLVKQKPHTKTFISGSKKLIGAAVMALILTIGLISFITTRNDSTLDINPTIYDNTKVIPSIQENLDLSREYFNNNDLVNALKYAQLAADSGDAHGIYNIAMIQEKLGNLDDAEKFYLQAVKLNYGDAFLNLGSLYIDKKQFSKGIDIYQLGIKQNHLGSMNALAFYYSENGKNSLAKDLYLQAAEQGHAMSMFNYALLKEKEGDKATAKAWLTKALDAGYSDAAVELGFIYEKESNWVKARKYYEIAAKSNDPYGMYNLAIVLGNHFSDQGSYPCELLSDALKIKGIEQDLVVIINEAIAQGCASKSSSKSSGATVSSPKPNPSSSGSLAPSPPESAKVVAKEIFGRPFDSSTGLDWLIPLTNSNTESVPPITNLQFRLLGKSNKVWLDIGYKLKKSEFGVQAQVDKIFFEILFKTSVCPEFRFVRIENNLVTNVWTKAYPECSTDYVP